MEAPRDSSEAAVGDLVVHLRRRWAFMAQHSLGLLDADPQLGHLLTGRVAQQMEGNARGNDESGGPGVLSHYLLNARIVKPVSPSLEGKTEEEGFRGLLRPRGKPGRQRRSRVLGKGEHLLFRTFPGDADSDTIRIVQVEHMPHVKAHDFADPQAHLPELADRAIAQDRRVPPDEGAPKLPRVPRSAPGLWDN